MNPLREERIDARVRAADAGYQRLRAAETAIEQALSVTADLAADLPRLRAQARLSSVFGHDAVDETVVTLGHLSAALGGIVRTHDRMKTAGSKIGYRARAEGGVDKPGEEPPPHGWSPTVVRD